MKLFEDLPSQNTSITAEMLNQIQDNLVVVSTTEPTGDSREKVWIQKGKNLFNKNSGIVSGSYLGNDGRIGSDINLFYQTDYIPAAPNTKYVISSDIGENHRIAEYDNNKTFIKRNLNDGGGSAYVFTTSSNCYFVRISCNISNLDSIQLEQNSTATEYEAYIEPKIYVKNDNDVYEEFISKDNLEKYSTTEQKIGVWIDGKPIYRKVISCGALPNATTNKIPYNISNLDKVIHITGYSYNSTADTFMSIPLVSSGTTNVVAYINKKEGKVVLTTTNDRSEYNETYVVLEYTKTTD